MDHLFDDRETLLLDLDGTLLDLAYDNYVWLEALPTAFAAEKAVSEAEARQRILGRIERLRGTMNWYCLDDWSDALDFDVMAVKRAEDDRIAWLEGAEAFLHRARLAGYRLVLVTNSVRQLLEPKDGRTQVLTHMDAAYSSQDFGAPKETQTFWQRFSQVERIDRRDCLLIDDSAPVLHAGRTFGLGAVLGLRRPDTSRPARDLPGLPTAESVAELLLGN
ncbi:MAG: HAD family hydrolase [Pseudomonadota bacterium]